MVDGTNSVLVSPSAKAPPAERPFVRFEAKDRFELLLTDAAHRTNDRSPMHGQKRLEIKLGFAKGLWRRSFQRLLRVSERGQKRPFLTGDPKAAVHSANGDDGFVRGADLATLHIE